MKNKLSKFRFAGLCILLVMSILICSVAIPVSADPESASGGNGSSAVVSDEELKKIVLDKYVTVNDDDTYTLDVETYVTGDIVVVHKDQAKPADIVMIMDTSGSMGWAVGRDSDARYNEDSRLDVLKSSATQFLTNLAATGSDIRISLVEFAGSASIITTGRGITNDSGFVSLRGSGGNVNTTLTSKISGLRAGGGTYMDEGFEQAYSSISGRSTKTYTDESGATQNRKVAVLFFTDGYPGSSGNFDDDDGWDVANGAIAQADKIKKEYNADIYTVGLLNKDGVGPNKDYNFSVYDGSWTDSLTPDYKAMNALMHFLSSDYQDTVKDMTTPKRNSIVDNGFYHTAKTAADLAQAFADVSERIIYTITVEKLDKKTVVRDILSNYFELPAGKDDIKDIRLYVENCNGYNATTGKFSFDTANRKQISPFSDSPYYDEQYKDIEVSIKDYPDSSGKPKSDISVTGYDYRANCVAYDSDEKTAFGQKLIIEFDIKLIEGFAGGNKVPTNNPNSGIYIGDFSAKSYPEPSINKELIEPDFSFNLEDIAIYKGNKVKIDEFLDIPAAEGLQYDYVERKVYIKNDQGNYDLLPDDIFDPEKTTFYPEEKIKIEFVPKDIALPEIHGVDNPPTVGDATITQPSSSTNQKSFTIYVLEPKANVTANDIQRFYGESYTLGDFAEAEKPSVTVDWKEPDDGSITASTNKAGVTMPFTADDIKLDYSATGYSGKITKKDITVAITPKFAKDVPAFFDAKNGESLSSQGVTPVITTACGFDCAASRTDGTYKVHSVTGTLTVTATGGNEGETHIYQIKDSEGKVYTSIPLTSGGAPVVIKELPAGKYTVVPVEQWDSNSTFEFTDGKESATFGKVGTEYVKEGAVGIEYTAKSEAWQGGFSTIAHNVYGVPHNNG